MKLFKTLTGVALVLVLNAAASATTLRTTPFFGYYISDGIAFCLVLNGGSTPGSATVQLYDASGNVLDTVAIAVLGANATAYTGGTFLDSDGSATFCKCTVPNATNWRCSFFYVSPPNFAGVFVPPVVIDGR